jgi:exopolysaccharide biosynthesis predicted pyruvyltransferase EpsI
MPALLPPDRFAPIFAPYAGRSVVVVDGVGNVGDHMIYRATRQLLGHFGVRVETSSPRPGAAAVLFFGGGNVGGRYPNEDRVRDVHLRRARRAGVPAVLLPQSIHGPADLSGFARVFVRDQVSKDRFAPNAVLAPDLALGLHVPPAAPPVEREGVFLRTDAESLDRGRPSLGDPGVLAPRVEAYLALAARYERVVTDRLHFAVAGLLAGREVTLLPNDYHKNRAVWEAWLAALGCRWGERP